MKTTLELTDTNFDTVINDPATPVVVDFWAEWCGPCKMLGPVLEEIATEQAGKAIIGKVDVDRHPELAARFQIQGIPTLLFFRGGEVRDRIVGLASKKSIVARLAAGTGDQPT